LPLPLMSSTPGALSAGWSDYNGKQANDNQDLFSKAASHVQEMGLTFGGGSFFPKGVEGTGGITITGITVTPAA
jgi:hypothetical protein